MRRSLRSRAVPLLAVLAAILVAAPGAAAAERGSSASFTPRAANEPGIAPDVLFPVGGPSVTKAWELSVAHWGASPCGGKVEISWGRLDAGVNATARWYNPTDAWNNAAANFNCRVDFNADMAFDWVKFCTVMAHEAGHLLGRQHVAGDRLMGELYAGGLPLCEQTPDPAAAPPPPAAPARVDTAETADSTSPRPQRSLAGSRWAGRATKGATARPRPRRCALKAGRRGARRIRRFTCGRAAPMPRRRATGWAAA